MGEKTHRPTHQRLRQALRKGDVAVSQDIVKVLKLAVLAEVAFALVPAGRSMVADLLSTARLAATQPLGLALGTLARGSALAVFLLVGFPAAAALLGLAGTLAQTGFNIAGEALQKGPERLDPAANLKNLFSARKLMMVPIGLLKAGTALTVGWVTLRAGLVDDLGLYRLSAEQGVLVGLGAVHSLERALVGVLLAWAVVDFALQKFMHLRSLRMDREEVQRDYKEAEGDPHAKGHRKAIAKQVALEPVKSVAPGASAVVVNPEHIAVAIAFDKDHRLPPLVVGVGRDADAAFLREVAAVRRLPIVKFVGLARRLAAVASEGNVVPPECLRAVALLSRVLDTIGELEDVRGNSRRAYLVDDDEAEAVLQRRSRNLSLKVCDLGEDLDDPGQEGRRT